VVGAAFPLAAEAHDAIARLRAADPRPVVAAGFLHAAMLVASSLLWRRAFGAFGGRVGYADAFMRYGVGTFLNVLVPARAGGAVRIGLFSRSLGGERTVQRSGVAVLAIGVVRIASVTALLAAGAAAGLAPAWLAGAPVVVAAIAALAHRRLRLVREHLSLRPASALLALAALASTCRCAAIGAALMAVGVHSPFAAAVIGLLGLELSVLMPLAPGLAGVGGAAVAVAIAAHGVPTATAVAGGVAFYVAEGVAGIVFGAVATAGFLLTGGVARASSPVQRDVPVPVW
jgi:uncharacterized membrane protein YbhN (UPF0104 family)